jgi:hypothetical protein
MFDPSQPARIVRINPSQPDTAVDTAKSDMGQYAKTRDEKHLKFKDGRQPDRFVMVPLTGVYVALCLDSVPSEPLRLMLAVQASCRGVECADGSRMDVDTTTLDDVGIDEVKLAPRSWAAKLIAKFGVETLYELGRFAIARAKLPEGADGPFG